MKRREFIKVALIIIPHLLSISLTALIEAISHPLDKTQAPPVTSKNINILFRFNPLFHAQPLGHTQWREGIKAIYTADLHGAEILYVQLFSLAHGVTSRNRLPKFLLSSES